jgi:predicted nucleotidyltransferase
MHHPNEWREHQVIEAPGPPMLDQEDQERFRRVLSEAQQALSDAGLLFAVVGGIPSSVYGRPRWTHDIDIFLRPHDARKALEIIGEAGFSTEQHDTTWLYKAYKDGVLVDLVFKGEGDVYLDAEMAARIRTIDYEGVKVQAASPEDIVVVKAVVHREDTSRYWFDALSVIARTALDWDYLLWRSRVAPARVLSLLVYAVSNGLAVPKEPLVALYDSLFESGRPLGSLRPHEAEVGGAGPVAHLDGLEEVCAPSEGTDPAAAKGAG